jgi:hypothetical protein
VPNYVLVCVIFGTMFKWKKEKEKELKKKCVGHFYVRRTDILSVRFASGDALSNFTSCWRTRTRTRREARSRSPWNGGAGGREGLIWCGGVDRRLGGRWKRGSSSPAPVRARSSRALMTSVWAPQCCQRFCRYNLVVSHQGNWINLASFLKRRSWFS